jgi:class 3 adenylate cyclase
MVMHVKGDLELTVALGRLLAELIPGAIYEEIDGADHFFWIMPNWRDIADKVIKFATGTAVARVTTRRFGTVMFTDIVGSTKRSSAVGDSNWREVLDSHDRITRGLIDQHRGRVVKSTGDGLLAVFEAPSQGVACGLQMCDALRGIGVEIRAGVHAGEIEVHDDGDISGIAVNLAARVEQKAAGGELWTSSTVRDMMLGGTASFAERGEHELKGIEGRWRLFAVSSSSSSTRSLASSSSKPEWGRSGQSQPLIAVSLRSPDTRPRPVTEVSIWRPFL